VYVSPIETSTDYSSERHNYNRFAKERRSSMVADRMVQAHDRSSAFPFGFARPNPPGRGLASLTSKPADQAYPNADEPWKSCQRSRLAALAGIAGGRYYDCASMRQTRATPPFADTGCGGDAAGIQLGCDGSQARYAGRL
jgi:hypothetical protein